MAPKVETIQKGLRHRVTSKASDRRGPGIELTIKLAIYADGSCQYDGHMVGNEGENRAHALYEHFTLELIQLESELRRLRDGRRDLLLLLPRGEREDPWRPGSAISREARRRG